MLWNKHTHTPRKQSCIVPTSFYWDVNSLLARTPTFFSLFLTCFRTHMIHNYNFGIIHSRYLHNGNIAQQQQKLWTSLQVCVCLCCLLLCVTITFFYLRLIININSVNFEHDAEAFSGVYFFLILYISGVIVQDSTMEFPFMRPLFSWNLYRVEMYDLSDER